jgi:hypothetical protein
MAAQGNELPFDGLAEMAGLGNKRKFFPNL